MSIPEQPENHRLRSTDYHSFRPTTHVFSRGEMKRLADHNITADVLSGSGSLDYKKMQNYLQELGFHRLHEQIRAGRHALVFEGSAHRMIRIVDAAEEPRSADPDMLQPIMTQTIAGYRVEVLPEVKTLAEIYTDLCNTNQNAAINPEQYGLTVNFKREIEDLVQQLIQDNLRKDPPMFFWDFSLDNIGVVMHEGRIVPLIIDPGAVSPWQRMSHETRQNKHVAHACATKNMFKHTDYKQFLSLSATDSNAMLPYLDFIRAKSFPHEMPYPQAQEAYLESLGLEKGKLKGLGAEVNSLMCDLQRKFGFSEAEMGYVAQDALDAHSKQVESDKEKPLSEQNRQGFCQLIREQAAKHAAATQSKS